MKNPADEAVEGNNPMSEQNPTGWQPIDTAPKDGRELLIWTEHGDCGRFIGAGASMAMRYSGYPPTPDHEDFRCAPCVERLGPLTEDKP